MLRKRSATMPAPAIVATGADEDVAVVRAAPATRRYGLGARAAACTDDDAGCK
jgi:hypothetical protein